jgi:hypothetical protein
MKLRLFERYRELNSMGICTTLLLGDGNSQCPKHVYIFSSGIFLRLEKEQNPETVQS